MSFVSATCEGEVCFCGRPAAAKVGEEIPFDHPHKNRHNLTRYVCGHHFDALFKRSNWPGESVENAVDVMIEMGEIRDGESEEVKALREQINILSFAIMADAREKKSRINALFDRLHDVRTTVNITRTQIMVELNNGQTKWDGVPEMLKAKIDEIDKTLENKDH